MAEAGLIRIDISDAILGEIIRVLREDFAWDGYRLHFLRQKLLGLANHVTPRITLQVVDDPDDDRIIECAVEAGSAYIVTNDKALLRIGEYAGIRILRISDFLKV
jgi:predicted nucleic acid-binding protein